MELLKAIAYDVKVVCFGCSLVASEAYLLFSFLFRLCLVRVKPFPENILFSGNAIFRKGKRFHVFGRHKIHFTENYFWCLVHLSILPENASNPAKRSSDERRDRRSRSCRSSIDERTRRTIVPLVERAPLVDRRAMRLSDERARQTTRDERAR